MFDTILMVDWSGGNDRGPTPKKDAIWTCIAGQQPIYHRNRQLAETYLAETLATEIAAGRKTLVGFDLCFAYPLGFARVLTGTDDPLTLWDWFAARVTDTPVSNNRFDLAAQINAHFAGVGPFWGNALKRDIADLPRLGTSRHGHGLPEKRPADFAAKSAFSPWQLSGAGAVGGQTIMGLPMLSRLRHRFAGDLSVWPFQHHDTPVVLAEVYLSLFPLTLRNLSAQGGIRDANQTALLANQFAALPPADMNALLSVPATPEGWTLGLGHENLLGAAA